MKQTRWSVVVCLVLMPLAALGKEAHLSMIYTNAMANALPFEIFSKGGWAPDPKARFVKLHLYFDEPITLKGLEIDSCGTLKKDDLSIFFNFDQWLLSLSPELKGEIPSALTPKRKGDKLVIEGFDKSVEVRSLTFNFEHNTGFRICSLRLLDPLGEAYTVKTPLGIQGAVSADSILEPRTAYDPLYLFDSRFEYGWASNKQDKNVSLTFDFDQPRRIEKLRLWNGYQRSVSHYLSNSRPSRVLLSGDDGYSAVIEINDQLGSQVVTLPKPFTGKQLKFTIEKSVSGKHYKDLVVSEIRFFDGKGWFMVDPTDRLRDTIAANRQQFAATGVEALLNDSYEAVRDNGNESYVSSKLRLRADGSMYISGYLDDSEYFALGNYEIKQADSKGIQLRLFGLYYESEVYGDCNGCGRDCNKSALPEPDPAQKIFQEFVTLRPVGAGRYELVNKSGGRKLKFNKLIYSREK